MGNIPPLPKTLSCWQCWVPLSNGVITADMLDPQKGCDNAACEKAVCDCNSYSYDVA